ncbi:hypothetical protein FOZ60_002805 [Perkinsus olseni]|uniref:Uncharacterized protein n=1 Tax=Perkinsus olseni TaxID=32597 RepID=A0A7J6NX52_PEROL|nr:hypothetical protein FOZ60_002805 [Perkinsus olseni]
MGNISDGGFGGLLDQYREISEAMPLTVPQRIDKRRCFRAALCQLFVFGRRVPMTYFWYDILLPSWSDYLPTTAHKVLVDQTLWCCTFLSTFFFIQSLAGGMSVAGEHRSGEVQPRTGTQGELLLLAHDAVREHVLHSAAFEASSAAARQCALDGLPLRCPEPQA